MHGHTHSYAEYIIVCVVGCWSLQCDQGGASVVLHSLNWPGMVAYHVPNSTNYAYFYSGTGEKNLDLVFML